MLPTSAHHPCVQAWERLALAAGRVSKARAWYAWGALLASRRALAARVEQLWYERACCGARAALCAWARWRTAHLALERRAAVALAFWQGASVRGCWVLWLEVRRTRGSNPRPGWLPIPLARGLLQTPSMRAPHTLRPLAHGRRCSAARARTA